MDMEDIRDNFRDAIRRHLRQGAGLEDALENTRRDYRGFLTLPGVREIFETVASEFRERFGAIERIGTGHVLQDPAIAASGWYEGPSSSPQSFWQRYRARLLNRGWSDQIIERIDRESTLVVSRLAPPQAVQYSRKGLVVGHVQSGKTANMIGMIAKARDAGYRHFLILAGTTEKLREQTQRRFEEDLGIREDPSAWFCLTSTDIDFDAGAANQIVVFNQQASLAIVKKNAQVLGRVLKAVKQSAMQVLKGPWIVVDDECDNASINVAYGEDAVAAINGKIRAILDSLSRVNYVGYTATPYANVQIDPHVSPDQPPDLYPRDFIIALSRPDDYQGPEVFFGKDPLAAPDDSDDRAIDLVRLLPADEVDRWVHWARGCHRPPEMTASLEAALIWFVLASAARCLRARTTVDTSMLVHASHRVSCHRKLGALIDRWLDQHRTAWRNQYREMVDVFRRTWDRETAAVNPAKFGKPAHSFDDLRAIIGDVLERTRVVEVHSETTDELIFDGNGHHQIVVGGNILSRGLTLEGLVSSFFTRHARQYDTLMQMARWFGYRRCYEDLPRVWTSEQLYYAFSQLVQVETELREEMEVYMRDGNVTPMDYAPRIRRSPGLLVTARNKMGAAITVQVSFSDRHLQTRRFHHRDRDWLAHNLEAMTKLLSEARTRGTEESRTGGRVYRNVPVDVVTRFLKNYRIHPAHVEMPQEKIVEYIARRNSREELLLWNIVVVEPEDGRGGSRVLKGFGEVRKVIRARLRTNSTPTDADIKALMGRRDILLDLPPDGGVPGPKSDSWHDLKAYRSKSFRRACGFVPGLMLMYLIDRESPPRGKGGNREALGAVEDVAAMGIVFPQSKDVEGDYVTVRLEVPPDSEGCGEEGEDVG